MVSLPPYTPINPYQGNSSELIKSVLINAKNKVDFLTIGPLTNLAEALKLDPALKNKIGRIYIMGGALSVQGNVMPAAFVKNRVAECNIYMDPVAAYQVFSTGIPITLIPLDITNSAPIELKFYRELKKLRSASPVANFVYKSLSRFVLAILIREYYFWDPLAAAIIARPDLYTVKKMSIDIIQTPGKYSGQTLLKDGGFEVDVVNTIQNDAFENLLLASYQ